MGNKFLVAALALALVALATWGSLELSGVEDPPIEAPGISAIGEGDDAEDVASAEPSLEGRFTPNASARGRDSSPTVAPAGPDADTAHDRPESRVGRVSGRVLDAQGQVPEGATVSLVNADRSSKSRPVELDAEGRFVARELESGTHALVVRARGYATLTVVVEPGGEPIALTLEEAVSIAGRVVPEDPRIERAGLVIVARPEESPVAGWSASAGTDAEGRFEIEGLAPGRYLLSLSDSARARGLAPVRVGPVATGRDDLEIPLRHGDELSGTIVDAGGELVTTPVRVEALGLTDEDQLDYDRRYFAAATGGVFRIRGVVPGRYALSFDPIVSSDDTSLTGPRTTYVDNVTSGSTDIQVTMLEGAAVHGRLVTASGDAVTGKGFVQVRPTGSPSGGRRSVMLGVDAEGRFRTPPLDTALTYTVFVGGFDGFAQTHADRVTPSETPIVVTVPGALRITGRVVDEKGRPAVGTSVAANAYDVPEGAEGRRAFCYVDHLGRFSLDGLKDYEYTLRAGGASSGFVSVEPKKARAGATDVVLKVRKGVALSGRIVDAYERPIETSYISITDGTSVWFSSTSDDEGNFRFPGLPRGKLRISARLDGEFVSLGEVEAPSDGVVLVAPE